MKTFVAILTALMIIFAFPTALGAEDVATSSYDSEEFYEELELDPETEIAEETTEETFDEDEIEYPAEDDEQFVSDDERGVNIVFVVIVFIIAAVIIAGFVIFSKIRQKKKSK